MPERPTKDASRADWDDYAKSLGLNPDEYSNKEALIEAAEAEEIVAGVDDDDDDDATDGGPVDLGTPPEPPGDLVEKGKEGKYPEGYEDASDSWKKAYDHAVSAGNPPKTAIVFADIHHDSEEFGA